MRLLFILLTRGLIVLAVFWLLRWLAAALSRPGVSSARAPTREPTAEALIKDPVCGTYVAEATSLKTGFGAEEHHFCSRQCLEKYIRSRDQSRS